MSEERWENCVYMGDFPPEGDHRRTFISTVTYPLSRIATLSQPADSLPVRKALDEYRARVMGCKSTAIRLCQEVIRTAHEGVDVLEERMDSAHRDADRKAQEVCAAWRLSRLGGEAESK